MKYNQIFFTPAAASTTGFAASVTGATFTLTATSSGDGLAHRVTILNNSATDHSGKTLTLTGTSPDGKAQTETFAAPGSSATVTSPLSYLTLTSITVSATIGADTFSIGWNNSFVGATEPINWRGGAAQINVDITGTINYDLQQTFDDIQFKTTAFVWGVAIAGHAAATADLNYLYEGHPKAIRIVCNSYNTGATVVLSYTQRNV
jgi:hypothetical protein